jgi:hypothetical protein
VELEYESCNVVQLRVVSVVTRPERIEINLGSKHTDCLAKELGMPSSRGVASTSCC